MATRVGLEPPTSGSGVRGLDVIILTIKFKPAHLINPLKIINVAIFYQKMTYQTWWSESN